MKIDVYRKDSERLLRVDLSIVWKSVGDKKLHDYFFEDGKIKKRPFYFVGKKRITPIMTYEVEINNIDEISVYFEKRDVKLYDNPSQIRRDLEDASIEEFDKIALVENHHIVSKRQITQSILSKYKPYLFIPHSNININNVRKLCSIWSLYNASLLLGMGEKEFKEYNDKFHSDKMSEAISWLIDKYKVGYSDRFF